MKINGMKEDKKQKKSICKINVYVTEIFLSQVTQGEMKAVSKGRGSCIILKDPKLSADTHMLP